MSSQLQSGQLQRPVNLIDNLSIRDGASWRHRRLRFLFIRNDLQHAFFREVLSYKAFDSGTRALRDVLFE